MLCSHLAREGVDTTVVTTELPTGATNDPPAERCIPAWDWQAWQALGRICREAEVVHIQYQAAAYGLHPAINLWPRWLRMQRRRPRVVTTFHDLRVPYLFPKAGPLRWWVTLALARGSDAVIVTNAADEARLRAAGLGDTALARIPLGNNIPVSPPAEYDRGAWRDRLGVTQGEYLLVHFGFLNSSKGCETLVDALARLRRAGLSVRLLMIGGRTGDADPTNVAYAARIEELIAGHNLEAAVIWTDFVSPVEVSAHLLAGDAAVLPYRDGASLRRTTLITALAHGLPVITTQPEHPIAELRDGDNVVLVPRDDPRALARAIALVLQSDDTRRRLGRGAQSLAKAFDWEEIARKTARLYRRRVT
jgi:glycosyltransferase involved in cell wall biosynthesis